MAETKDETFTMELAYGPDPEQDENKNSFIIEYPQKDWDYIKEDSHVHRAISTKV